MVRAADAGTKNRAGGHTVRVPEYMNARNIIITTTIIIIMIPTKLNDV